MPTPQQTIEELKEIAKIVTQRQQSQHNLVRRAASLPILKYIDILVQVEVEAALEQAREIVAKYGGDIQQRDETIQELRTAMKLQRHVVNAKCGVDSSKDAINDTKREQAKRQAIHLRDKIIASYFYQESAVSYMAKDIVNAIDLLIAKEESKND